jgi:hypothetical protein
VLQRIDKSSLPPTACDNNNERSNKPNYEKHVHNLRGGFRADSRNRREPWTALAEKKPLPLQFSVPDPPDFLPLFAAPHKRLR